MREGGLAQSRPGLCPRSRLLCLSQKTLVFFILIFAALMVVHHDLIRKDPLLDYDDDIVVMPMATVTSVGEYLAKVQSGEILDRQPVRDLSLWWDYQVEKFSGFSVHHLHNVLLWFCTAVFFFAVLGELAIPLTLRFFLVALFAFHPCLTEAVAWATARKHILSALFTLIATWCLLKSLKQEKLAGGVSTGREWKFLSGMILSYGLACFSQPINLGFFVWAILMIAFSWREIPAKSWWRRLLLLSLFAGIFLATFAINYHYYNYFYLEQSYGVGKFTQMKGDLVSQSSFPILALGASYFQILIPIWPTPSSYYPGSARNLWGMMLLVLSLYAIYKASLRRKLVLWVLFAALPLLTVTVKMTNIFGSDTYLIISVAGVYLIIAHFIPQNKYTKYAYAFLSGLVVFFIYSSYQVAQSWISEKELWSFASQNEETPNTVKKMSHLYFLEKNYGKSFEQAIKLWDWNPFMSQADLVYGRAIYFYPQFSIVEKIEWLNRALKKMPYSIWLKYFLSSVYASQHHWSLAYQQLSQLELKDFQTFRGELSGVAAEYHYFCLKGSSRKKEECDSILVSISQKYEKIWKKSQFEKRWEELQISLGH
jgi:hypothetical protein